MHFLKPFYHRKPRTRNNVHDAFSHLAKQHQGFRTVPDHGWLKRVLTVAAGAKHVAEGSNLGSYRVLYGVLMYHSSGFVQSSSIHLDSWAPSHARRKLESVEYDEQGGQCRHS